ncbi:Shedu anti-phage system protein SduA domain-containing protein [Martelella limonii]|uniref:Shedu anti-phage system protein SduA domain-containing protein n=1 Tax=Martelella limonii TaxID=1647649 RepID=UPI00157FEFF7|nr:Shedu anti-phage system protein SduA domain-containing protein [Martelella limonii]
MDFFEYRKYSTKRWNGYFKLLSRSGSRLQSPEGCVTLFPTHIVFMNFGDQYGMELIGASRSPRELQPRIAKYEEIHMYFDIFKGRVEGGSTISIEGKDVPYLDGFVSFSNILFCQGKDFDSAKNRFGFISEYGTILNRTGGEGSHFHFNSSSQNLLIENCGILNHHDGLFRGKNILLLGIHGKSINSNQLEKFFHNLLGVDERCQPVENGAKSATVRGVATVKRDSVAIFESSMLQNVALSGGLRETTIDEYLATHPNILEGLFNSARVIHNAALEWIEHDGGIDEKSIKPDAFILRRDGYFDIADFKLAAIDKKSLTRGKRSRRRFIDYVNEGLSQLANYQSYFGFDKNKEYAWEKYNIKVDNPKKILIVGSMENSNPEEIHQALRAYDSSYSIIDYDAIAIGHQASVGWGLI